MAADAAGPTPARPLTGGTDADGPAAEDTAPPPVEALLPPTIDRPASARSALMTVLGEFVLPNGGRAWTSTLLHVLGLVGFSEKNARQALFRAANEGLQVSHRAGRRVRWELTDSGRALLEEGAARIYGFLARSGSWDGRWVVLSASVPESQRHLRYQLRARLSWAGFGSPAPGLWVSPHSEKEAEARDVVAELGLRDGVFSYVGTFGSIGREDAVVRQAWDLDDVARRYADFVAAFSPRGARAGDEVLTAQVHLVQEWRHFPFLDPGLPAELLPEGWNGFEARRTFDARNEEWCQRAQARWRELEARAGD